MPLRPSVQAPRRSLCSTVSAWSSRVCAVATASDLAIHHQLPEEGIAKIAGGFLQGFVEGGGSRGCVGSMEMEWQVMGCGQPGNKSGVFFSQPRGCRGGRGPRKGLCQACAAPLAGAAAGRRSRRPRKPRRRSADRDERDCYGELAKLGMAAPMLEQAGEHRNLDLSPRGTKGAHISPISCGA